MILLEENIMSGSLDVILEGNVSNIRTVRKIGKDSL